MLAGLRRPLILALMGFVLASCGVGEPRSGTFSATFIWPGDDVDFPMWAYARVEKNGKAGRIQVAEAPVARFSPDLRLEFPSVAHGDGYVVVVELKRAADKQARTLYFGESTPFSLRPGKHSEVSVPLALAAAPSLDPGDGALRVVEANALNHVRTQRITLSLAPKDATAAVIAHDFQLNKGRKQVELTGLAREGERFLIPWDLDLDLCKKPPCPDGQRTAFVQLLNAVGYPSEVAQVTVELDRTPPTVAAFSLSPNPAKAEARVALVVNPSEPLLQPPELRVRPEHPGFGPFKALPGGAYIAELAAVSSEDGALQRLELFVDLIDEAENQTTVDLVEPLVLDAKPPELTGQLLVEPLVVHDGETFVLSFELDEATEQLPTVRVADTPVQCVWIDSTQRLARCEHVASQLEGSGEQQIEIEVRDAAGNAATIVAGSVHYDTLPRCGNAIIDETLLETCDEGPSNSDEPDASCRTDCKHRRCGDGVVDPASREVCDPPPGQDRASCSADCSYELGCGNGLLEEALGEECDDGNLLSHDGCSSRCRPEEALWREPPPPTLTGSFSTYDHDDERMVALNISELTTPMFAILHDARHHRLLAFTGDEDGLMRTRVEENGRWNLSPRSGKPTPPGEFATALVYEAARGRIMMFGGLAAGTRERLTHQETWVLEGDDWRQMQPDGPIPSARLDHAMAYDPVRDRVVLFGGDPGDGTALFGDTWEWDGSRWTQKIPEGPWPHARMKHGMAYDPVRQRVVLSGGQLEGRLAVAETWEWDGRYWELQSEVDAGAGPMMGYDFSRRAMIMSGKAEWEWTDSGWTQRGSGKRLPFRAGFAATFDALHQRGVLFGGHKDFDPAEGLEREYLDDTYTWTSDFGWNPVEIEGPRPIARTWAAMAHDPIRGVTVLYGGETELPAAEPTDPPCEEDCKGLRPLHDTWEFADGRWQQMRFDSASPAAGPLAVMVYDLAGQQMILIAPGPDDTMETWALGPNGWVPTESKGPRPPARTEFGAAYDAGRKHIVLFGGRYKGPDGETILSDTWTWANSEWQERQPARSPPPRYGHGMHYDAARGIIQLHAGSYETGPAGDTWEWDGVRWRVLAYNHSTHEEWHSLFLDPTVGLLALETYDMRSLRYLEEVTCLSTRDTYRPCERMLLETCVEGADADGDGLAGCDDPDCVSYCFPLCNPWLASCPEDWPHCGDGTCAGVENCARCSSDCGVCPALCGDQTCDPQETPATCPGDCQPSLGP